MARDCGDVTAVPMVEENLRRRPERVYPLCKIKPHIPKCWSLMIRKFIVPEWDFMDVVFHCEKAGS